MKIERILFIGGNPRQYPSVQIRCKDVADGLGCDTVFSVHKADQIPWNYSVFVCVKSELKHEELQKLAKRGPIVWDMVDRPPPKEAISVYLFSTKNAEKMFHHYGATKIIPHHHCNFSGVPNPPNFRRAAWVGTSTWYPKGFNFEHDVYKIRRMSASEVGDIYRKVGIGLNMRAITPSSDFHVKVNTGIKLINCIGFGIPSISDDEPGYHEAGEDCTIFSDLQHCEYWVSQLRQNDRLYQKLRTNCIGTASRYSISTIVKEYQAFLNRL